MRDNRTGSEITKRLELTASASNGEQLLGVRPVHRERSHHEDRRGRRLADGGRRHGDMLRCLSYEEAGQSNQGSREVAEETGAEVRQARSQFNRDKTCSHVVTRCYADNSDHTTGDNISIEHGLKFR